MAIRDIMKISTYVDFNTTQALLKDSMKGDGTWRSVQGKIDAARRVLNIPGEVIDDSDANDNKREQMLFDILRGFPQAGSTSFRIHVRSNALSWGRGISVNPTHTLSCEAVAPREHAKRAPRTRSSTEPQGTTET